MKTLFLIILLSPLVVNAQWGTQRDCRDCVVVNNRTIDLSNPKIKRLQLFAIGNTAVTARIVSGSAMPMYQPASNTRAEIIGIQGYGSGAASTGRFGYGDNHTTGGAIPTNPVYCASTGAAGAHYGLALNEQKDFNCLLNIPSGKYIFVNQSTGTDGAFDVYVRESPE